MGNNTSSSISDCCSASLDIQDARGKTPIDLAKKAGLKLEVQQKAANVSDTTADTDEALMNQLEQELSNQPVPLS